jgi:hypothetical protein
VVIAAGETGPSGAEQIKRSGIVSVGGSEGVSERVRVTDAVREIRL